MERFKAREETAYKKWKIGSEDWRNREKWDQYDEAFEDMLKKPTLNMRRGLSSRTTTKNTVVFRR